MKKISKIKLNQLSKNELEQRKLNALRGGCDCAGKTICSCNCIYSYTAHDVMNGNFDDTSQKNFFY